MAIDPELLRHKEWLGFLQPVGLVVSPPALIKAQAIVNRNVVELQQRLIEVVCQDPLSASSSSTVAWVADFPAFATTVLEWQPEDLACGQALTDLEVVLPDYGETLSPTYAVPSPDGEGWLMLIQIISPEADLDQVDPSLEKSGKWCASPQAKFERLLREKEIAIGLLCNGTALRLIYAPRGESSGHVTFPIQAMCEVSGRLILGAMEMLLSAYRLFSAPSDRRLAALLAESRKYQNEVSTKLAEQVLEALWELLRGFQSADAAVDKMLLSNLASQNPQHIYGGLITTLMRLVFLLYAEDEGLMPQDAIYSRNYSITGLYERLREDAGNYPDTMDQRYGAWAWLLSLFRLVYEGGGHAPLYLPARQGQLFDPDEYPFLEGRSLNSSYRDTERLDPPRLSDGVIQRVLQGLLVLDGERLSYRSLDVEQIGSVYEAIMGFSVERAEAASIGVRPHNVVINVEKLLAAKPGDRAKLLKEWSACEIAGRSLTELKEAKTPADVVAAVGRKVSPRTSSLMPAGSLYLQPGEERRRSGTHYTPRTLTEPIVRNTLRPVLENLGEHPTADQILDLKVCDLAMGSGAFLVEACRQLADRLVEAWNYHGNQPENLKATEDPLSIARCLVAENCLYGVDRNPFAVNLAKLSLWLVTLAKERQFTFLDHALKCGDSLMGFTEKEFQEFILASDLSQSPLVSRLKEAFNKANFWLEKIRSLGIDQHDEKESSLSQAKIELAESILISDFGLFAYLASIEEWQKQTERALRELKLIGEAGLAAFFGGSTSRDRRKNLKAFSAAIHLWQATGDRTAIEKIESSVKKILKNLSRFHWIYEFPQVFNRENPGFDCIVGNPPFAGKNTITKGNVPGYLDWLKQAYPESHGNSDLVAYFYRRAFDLLRQGGVFGLIATNTIAQGDTRNTGLRVICKNGGTIYQAQRRFKWSGTAAVVVSVVNICKGVYEGKKLLDLKEVPQITAFLFSKGSHENPYVLLENAGKSFIGSYVLGMGFTFDDTSDEATPVAEMSRLIDKEPRNAECIFPYIGGSEVNSNPTHAPHRYVINFGEMSEKEARQYPDLIAIVEAKVKGTRGKHSTAPWWQFERLRGELYRAIAGRDQVLVIPRVSQTGAFTFLPNGMVYSEQLVVFAMHAYTAFCILQCRIHEVWARFLGSSMKDDLRYTPSDCFETFPFPPNWETNPNLEVIGKQYYDFRADLMVRNNQGLTETYNRFHNPNEFDPDIVQLRELHNQMDCVVLSTYGWSDLQIQCEFLLDYEDEEESEEVSSGRQRRKPWRYRWTEEFRDEILARLLDLNQKRHEQETLSGKNMDNSKNKKIGKKTAKAEKTNDTPPIPGLSI